MNTPLCPIHNTPMKFGKYGYFCTRKNDDDSWCNEKAPASDEQTSAPAAKKSAAKSAAQSNSFKTPKGTILPLLSLQGKPYLQVAHRIQWFREDHSDWSIETEQLTIDDERAIFLARIKDASGRIIATATKHETKTGFADFIEKAETGAIGRALALCGYGTQFAPELEEGDRLADSPIEPGRKPADVQRFEKTLPDKPAPTPKAKTLDEKLKKWKKAPKSTVLAEEAFEYVGPPPDDDLEATLNMPM